MKQKINEMIQLINVLDGSHKKQMLKHLSVLLGVQYGKKYEGSTVGDLFSEFNKLGNDWVKYCNWLLSKLDIKERV